MQKYNERRKGQSFFMLKIVKCAKLTLFAKIPRERTELAISKRALAKSYMDFARFYADLVKFKADFPIVSSP